MKVQAVGKTRDAEMQRLQAELQRVSAAAAQQEEAARQEVASIRSEAEQRQMQLAVIMETLEALQSGSDGQHDSISLHLLSFLKVTPCQLGFLHELPSGSDPGPKISQ